MDKNLKDYILELASECIIFSKEALSIVPSQYTNGNFFMLQAFYCAKKLEEIYYTEWQNIQLLYFYREFHIFNKKYLANFLTRKDAKNEFPHLNSIYEQLKIELSINNS